MQMMHKDGHICYVMAGSLQDPLEPTQQVRRRVGCQDALDEALIAVEQVVIPRQQPIELLPQIPELLDLQVGTCIPLLHCTCATNCALHFVNRLLTIMTVLVCSRQTSSCCYVAARLKQAIYRVAACCTSVAWLALAAYRPPPLEQY